MQQCISRRLVKLTLKTQTQFESKLSTCSHLKRRQKRTRNDIELNKFQSNQSSSLDVYRQLAKIKTNEPAVRTGETKMSADERTFSFSRCNATHCYVVVFNTLDGEAVADVSGLLAGSISSPEARVVARLSQHREMTTAELGTCGILKLFQQ